MCGVIVIDIDKLQNTGCRQKFIYEEIRRVKNVNAELDNCFMILTVLPISTTEVESCLKYKSARSRNDDKHHGEVSALSESANVRVQCYFISPITRPLEDEDCLRYGLEILSMILFGWICLFLNKVMCVFGADT